MADIHNRNGVMKFAARVGSLLKWTLATAVAGIALSIPSVSGGAVQVVKPAHEIVPTHRMLPPHVINPHLHGVTIHTAPKDPAIKRVINQHWHPRWEARQWIILHRGLGAIHGEVVNKQGEPAGVLLVNLQHPGGHALANTAAKHITYSNGSGGFNMMLVRAGKYRIVARKGKKIIGHTEVNLHAGQVADAVISVKG